MRIPGARPRSRPALLALVLGASCSEASDASIPFAFDRPELVELACIGSGTGEAATARALPMRCCSDQAPLADPDSPFSRLDCGSDEALGDGAPLDGPVLHALVAQSTRGELAAVDLQESRVLDSNVLTPGYNFIDVGGLPSAIVVPPRQPFVTEQQLEAAQPEERRAMGPPWVYVASAADHSVTAVATCRLRTGEVCGPELSSASAASLRRRARTALPGAPSDMVLGPDEALWVSMPGHGVARIELSPNPNEPFLMQGEGEDATPVPPTTFEVAVPTLESPDAAIVEDPAYRATCGLGYEYAPLPIELPLAPRARGSEAAQPTRMRYDSLSGLLFVADASLPVVHLFSGLEDGALIARGALPTGAPVRDFALTAGVPGKPPADLFQFAGQDSETRRYLYAIDDRDGSLMAFELDLGTQGPSLTPLQAPLAGRYRDRLRTPGPSVALEVLDTRGLSPEPCGMGAETAAGQTIVEYYEERVERLQEADRTEEEELAEAEQRLRIAEGAGPSQLRGVFLIVAGLDGVVSVIDVLDLDAGCRAKNSCAPDEPTQLVDADDARPLAVRRHAPRLSLPSRPRLYVGGAAALAANAPPCEDNYTTLVSDEPGVCVPRDTWNQLDQTWTVSVEAGIPGLNVMNAAVADGRATTPDGRSLAPNQLLLLAPAGVNLCARGLLANAVPEVWSAGSNSPPVRSDELAVEDRLFVVSEPPDHAASDCPSPNAGSEQPFRIAAAYRDAVVIEAPDAEVLDRLRRCYTDFLDFEVRTGESQYLVSGSLSGYLHRVTTGPDGQCVLDADLDPRFRARARGGERFKNPYVAFTLAEGPPRSLSLQIVSGRDPLADTVFDPSAELPDALPASVQFFPYTNDLFIVDSASQGLRRFGLSPFGRTGQTFR